MARSLLSLLVFFLLVPPANAGINIFIGSSTVPSASTDANVTAPAAAAIGDAPAGSVSSDQCDRSATTATISTQLSAATGGQTVCLASGSYGTVAITTSKTGGRVRITPASGASATIYPDFQGTSSGWTVSGFTGTSSLTGASVNDGQQGSHDITIQSNAVSGQIIVDTHVGTAGMLNGNILIDGNDIANVDATFTDGAILVGYLGGPGTNVSGVTVSNNTIHGGCSDGIQTGSYGALITRNTIYNKRQGSCGVHVDCMQSAGSSHETWTYNLCYDDDTGMITYNTECSPNMTVSHNAVRNISTGGEALVIGGAGCSANATFEHNTAVQGASSVAPVISTNSTNAVARNNVIAGGVTLDGTGQAGDYNLCRAGTCAGAHSLSGSTPVFVDSNFTTLAGAALASGSPGYLAGSDGTSMGVVP